MLRQFLQASLCRGVLHLRQSPSFTRLSPRIVLSHSFSTPVNAPPQPEPEILKHHSELKKELSYCDKIVDATRAHEAVKEYWAKGHKLDLDDYETLLKLLYKNFKGLRSWEVWEQLCNDAELDPSLEPKLVHYDQTLYALGAYGMHDQFNLVLSRMKQKKIKKESTTYEALITTAFKTGDPEKGRDLILEYQSLYDKKEVSGYWPYVRYLGYAANALQINEVGAFTVDQTMDALERRFDLADILKNDPRAAYILKLVKFTLELELEDDVERVHNEIEGRQDLGTKRTLLEDNIAQPL